MRSNAISVFLMIFACLIASGASCSGEDAHILTSLGGRMSPEEKVAAEAQVAKDPNDVESRTKLLGYYFSKGREDPDAKSAQQGHVVWLIENAPESEVLGLPYGELNSAFDPDGYYRAKRAWLKTIEKSPENLFILKNASSFFFLSDRKLSEELLLKGQKLDANGREWPASLGQLYALELMSLPVGPKRIATAEKAFRQFELAYERSNTMQKETLWAPMAKAALAAGLNDDAKKLATKMLNDGAADWNRGNLVHQGNLTLGRIALAEGNVKEAKSRLLLAGKTPGSPQLNSFGPNMQLAKELLEHGETEVVLEYFELCKKFWKSPNQQLERWADDVKGKRVPEFGGNLAY